MHGTNKGGRRERIVRLTAADAHACLSASLANTLLCLAFLDGWNSYLTARFDQRVRMVNFAQTHSKADVVTHPTIGRGGVTQNEACANE